MLAAVNQGQSMLTLQRHAARQPLDLMQLQEPQAPVLPLLLFSNAPETLSQRQRHPCNLFKPTHIQAPDRRAGYLENFA